MENQKTKVVVNITIPFWSAGWLYVVGIPLSDPVNVEYLAGFVWYKAVGIVIILYLVWPFALGMLHGGG